MILGAPSTARTGSGQAGDDSVTVRPSLPGKVVPGLYSTRFDTISPFNFDKLALLPYTKRVGNQYGDA
jgi:hypothetical protein